jgi:hypothetical protein
MLENAPVRGASVAGFDPVEKEMTLIFRNHFGDASREKEIEKHQSWSSKRKMKIPSTITIGPCAPYSPLHRGGIDFQRSMDSQDDICSEGTLRSCIGLLESEMNVEDCRFGMERLMKLVNSELVNFKKEGSVAQALVCGTEVGCRYYETQRLRKVFLSCFSLHASLFYDQGISSDSSSADYTDDSSSLTGSHNALLELRRPALRILASSLELVSMLDDSVVSTVDLSSTFWVAILGSMAEMTEVVSDCRIEATLSIKCIRLLYTMQPKTMEPYIRYSLLPYLIHAHEFGKKKGDRMLLREVDKILKPLGVKLDS